MPLPGWMQHVAEFDYDDTDEPPPPWLLKENYEADLKYFDDFTHCMMFPYLTPLPSYSDDNTVNDSSLFGFDIAVNKHVPSDPVEPAAPEDSLKNSQEPDTNNGSITINWSNDDSEEAKKEILRGRAKSVATEVMKKLHATKQKDCGQGSTSKQATGSGSGSRKAGSSHRKPTVSSDGGDVAEHLKRVHVCEEKDGAGASASKGAISKVGSSQTRPGFTPHAAGPKPITKYGSSSSTNAVKNLVI